MLNINEAHAHFYWRRIDIRLYLNVIFIFVIYLLCRNFPGGMEKIAALGMEFMPSLKSLKVDNIELEVLAKNFFAVCIVVVPLSFLMLSVGTHITQRIINQAKSHPGGVLVFYISAYFFIVIPCAVGLVCLWFMDWTTRSPYRTHGKMIFSELMLTELGLPIIGSMLVVTLNLIIFATILMILTPFFQILKRGRYE